MELSELSLRVEKLEEIIQELAKWTHFNLSTCQNGSLDIDWRTTPQFANVATSTAEISKVEEILEPISSVVIKLELKDEEESMESVVTNNIEEDLPENNVEWNDRLSNCDEDQLFLPSDGGEHSESASDFEEAAEPLRKRRKPSTRVKYEPLKIPPKSSLPPSEPFVSLRPLTPALIHHPDNPETKKNQEPNDLKCPSCPRKFRIKPNFLRHVGSGICKRGARPFACPHCPYAARATSHLSNHIKAIHPSAGTEEEKQNRPFSCPECPKTFRFKTVLSRHILCIHNGSIFLCDSCPYLGKNLRNFQQHIKNSHTEPSLFCYFCPWKGRRMDKLTIHMRIHTGEKPYKCPHCIYTSTDDETLKGHVKAIHGKDKQEGSFQCPKCPNRFKTQGVLARHLQIHDGTAYKCGICGFEGCNNASLKEHHKCHKTEDGKKFQCPHCPKMFKRSLDLTRHLRTHTGGKPYKCGKCEYASVRKDDLERHEKICNGNRKEKPEESMDAKDGEELPEQNTTSAPTSAQDEENCWN